MKSKKSQGLCRCNGCENKRTGYGLGENYCSFCHSGQCPNCGLGTRGG